MLVIVAYQSINFSSLSSSVHSLSYFNFRKKFPVVYCHTYTRASVNVEPCRRHEICDFLMNNWTLLWTAYQCICSWASQAFGINRFVNVLLIFSDYENDWQLLCKQMNEAHSTFSKAAKYPFHGLNHLAACKVAATPSWTDRFVVECFMPVNIINYDDEDQ